MSILSNSSLNLNNSHVIIDATTDKDLALNSCKISGVLDPTSAQDASTKNYTDTQVALCVKFAPSAPQSISNHPLTITTATASNSTTTGGLVVSGGVGVGGDCRVGGDVYATNVNTTSDARKKTNIETLEPSDNFDKIRPVSFNWKENGKPCMGVIAQEIQELYPSCVNEDEEGNLSVDYLQISAVLIAEVQALKKNQNN